MMCGRFVLFGIFVLYGIFVWYGRFVWCDKFVLFGRFVIIFTGAVSDAFDNWPTYSCFLHRSSLTR